jgi:hypothetical protein
MKEAEKLFEEGRNDANRVAIHVTSSTPQRPARNLFSR